MDIQLPTTDWISKWAVYSPHKVAVKLYETQQTLTYLELNQKANQLVHFLCQAYDLKKGDRIAVLANNCLEYIILFSAALKTGWILVPLNYRLSAPEIQYQLDLSEPSLFIIAENFADIAINFPEKINLSTLNQKMEKEVPGNPGSPSINENDPIFLLFTSGTTGFPKAAIYTHKMLFWNSINTAMSLLINTESRTINCMPPFHTGGWNVLLTPFLHHGGYTVLMEKFDPGIVLELMQKEAPTLFMGVPTMLKMIAQEESFQAADLSSLFYLIVGGEPMPIPLIEQWHEKGVFVRQGYGMTEVGPNLTSLHQEDAIRKKGSIGRPNFYVQIKIVGPKGAETPPNQAGELLLKGPMVTPGYWKNEKATRNAVQNGWFHTGDMAKQDQEGYLYIVDRIKNMFISGGENVYPAEVERIIATHPEIHSVAVIPQKDEKWGEVGKAFIVKAPQSPLTAESIRNYCSKNLAKYKIPKHFLFVKELPINSTGKIDRKLLSTL